ncbi:hypothetical protein PIB30_044524 [Stylosanthes scabra]|uniref:Uncharacterized protein n=1 Tax=Stylosanthes scabra TaxID=79078 RepID=A0ABU6RFX7_9FABA|nr:hypothetical protein [Stylosanthes scabra]
MIPSLADKKSDTERANPGVTVAREKTEPEVQNNRETGRVTNQSSSDDKGRCDEHQRRHGEQQGRDAISIGTPEKDEIEGGRVGVELDGGVRHCGALPAKSRTEGEKDEID